ncbi:lipocalin family protein [Dyadobacter sp. CY107]|uniref:lipocalin family protein n=1 Tax=Dyadobacter fanqingshengii TaxID=2906443 RepID=UPI001F1D83B6|nr:lipocalin family protein [Dyadobacter fanqingshengii]MCF2504044.1 lipocalin family protein [Dyadobacter fanqingshengii]
MKIYTALKKITLLAFLLTAFVVTACKDDDKEPAPVEDTNPIVGRWQLTAVTPETPGTTIPALAFIQSAAPCILELKLTFNSNNTITAADCPAAVSAIDPFVPVGTDAKWKVDGDKLTLSRGSTSQEFKIMQTDTNLTVVVNTQTDATKPPVNALLVFKKL